MNYRTFLFTILFGLLACTQNTEPVSTLPLAEILKTVRINLVGYDSLQVKSSPEFIFAKPTIKTIKISQQNDSGFTTILEAPANYYKTGNHFKLDFDFQFKVNRQTVFANLRLQFLSDSKNAIFELDTSIAVFKFPYPDVELLYYYNELLSYNQLVQSFDLLNNKIYMHGYGPSGLYSYDMQTGEKKTLVDYYLAGDHIACANDRIFLDVDHDKIFVYYINSSKVSMNPLITFKDHQHYMITGVDVLDEKLLVLWDVPDLYVYDFKGNLLDVIPYGRYSYSLTHADSILFSANFKSLTIVRFDLRSKTFLEEKPFPTSGTDALQVDGNYLYFNDFYKKFIGRVPLESINNFQQIEDFPQYRVKRSRVSE